MYLTVFLRQHFLLTLEEERSGASVDAPADFRAGDARHRPPTARSLAVLGTGRNANEGKIKHDATIHEDLNSIFAAYNVPLGRCRYS